MKKFPIDIIYTWVDGSDKQWIAKKNNLLNQYGSFHRSSDVSGKKRFRNNDELKYSLRSIEKFCPWVRNVYLITDNQIPNWLNLSCNNLKVIDHKDLFLQHEVLPSFNSNAIEMRMHHINNLSKNFLSFNDDIFVGRPSKIEDFFHYDGKPKLHMGKQKSKFKLKRLMQNTSKLEKFINKKILKKRTPHQFAILNSRKLIFKKFGIIINRNMQHSVKALNKNILFEIENKFPEAFQKTISNQFRDNSDTWIISLHAFYSIAKGINTPYYLAEKHKKIFIHKFFFLNKNADYSFVRLTNSLNKIKKKFSIINDSSPLSFCLNDWPGKNDNADKLITDFLIKLYPKKSRYEK